MNRSTHFKVFTDCKIVQGNDGALIYDLNRQKFHPLENRFADLLSDCDGKKITQIIDQYSASILLFLDKMVDADIAFYTDDLESFPDMNMEFMHPSKIMSAVLEIDHFQKYDIVKTLDQLNELGCKSLIIIMRSIDKALLSAILKNVSDSFVTSLELVLPADLKTFLDAEKYLDNLRISSILFYGSKKNSFSLNKYKVQIIESTEVVIDVEEEIVPSFFFTNVKMFSEAVSYNLGLNRKISVSSDGLIRNFINHKKTYGNINHVEILDVLNSPEFTAKWKISNDQIYKCKDCKFRYCCISSSEVYKKGNVFYKERYCSF